MTDINFRPLAQGEDENAAPEALGPGAETELFELIELLFFAYRDFTSDPNAILDQIGFGRAHHRVLHFVNRNPGLKVADLLDILKITKQSLGRVLKQLVDEGYIYQKTGPSDRRQRLLYPTPRGRELAQRLARPQFRRFAAAIAQGGPDEAAAAKRFLTNLIDEKERARVAAILRGGQGWRASRAGETKG